MQEATLAMTKALTSYRTHNGTFAAFVTGIAQHKITDAFRVAGRNRSLPSDTLPEASDGTAGPEELALRAERAARMEGLLAELLTDRQVLILRLRLLGNVPVAEVAAVLDMSPGSVRVAQHRALQKLRARIEADGVDVVAV